MSYLDRPRLSFAGFFQADVSTINNDVRYYDSASFRPEFQEQSLSGGKGAWNPEGTGVFRFVECQVTGAVLGDTLLTAASDDPVIGMRVENAFGRVSGKLVDLDPQQQLVSQIWGLQVRLASLTESHVMWGDYAPASFSSLWKRQLRGARLDQTLAANYQSILQRVHWHERCGSRVLDALRAATEHGQLAITFNVYGYARDPTRARVTQGRINGTIGPYRAHEPKHFVVGRQLVAAVSGNPTAPANGVGSFQAKVEGTRVTADFGHCLPIEDSDGTLVDLGALALAVHKQPLESLLSTVSAADIISLGPVDYQTPDWYARTAGVQAFDFADKPEVRSLLPACPLLLVRPQGADYQVLVQESLGGWHVRSDGYVLRANPGDQVAIDIYTSRYGQPVSAQVALSLTEGFMGGGAGSQPITPEVPVPEIGQPASALSFPAELRTDANGKRTLTLTAAQSGPGNPRGYIAGQLYGIAYALPQQPKAAPVIPWDYVSVLLFDATPVPAQPTWFDDIQPLLVQYGNLYPIMSKHVVRLDDYDSVVQHLRALRLAFSLPIEDPNHMPVTRDLSRDRLHILLRWMDNKGPDGKPLRGTPAPPPRAASPQHIAQPPAVPLDPQQTGGKTEVLIRHEAKQRARKERS